MKNMQSIRHVKIITKHVKLLEADMFMGAG